MTRELRTPKGRGLDAPVAENAIGTDDSADERAEHYAIGFLLVIAAFVAVVLAAMLWASIPNRVFWIPVFAIVAFALVIAELIAASRRHRVRVNG